MKRLARDQPAGLHRSGVARSQATSLLVEQALALLTQRQAHLPLERRRFPNAEILEAALTLRPELPLHLSTLHRNSGAAKLIAQARREGSPEPDFQRYGGWKPPRSSSIRSRSRRRAKLSKKSLAWLAEYVVGLEEVERHCIQRRQMLECVGWISGPWPSGHEYPLVQFKPSATVWDRYLRYFQRATREELSKFAVNLEQLLTEHLTQLLQYDSAYMQQLNTRLQSPAAGIRAHAQGRIRQPQK